MALQVMFTHRKEALIVWQQKRLDTLEEQFGLQECKKHYLKADMTRLSISHDRQLRTSTENDTDAELLNSVIDWTYDKLETALNETKETREGRSASYRLRNG